MMSKILDVRNVTVKFDDHAVLENLSFELDEGDNLAVIGPNGSGKTVFLRALLGMVSYEGSIEWTPKVRVAYVPQKIEADRHLPLDLRDLLEAKANIYRLPKKEIHEVIESVGIDKKILHTSIGHLSGGQFQKALIALALLGNPKVVLFDEPTASLDQPQEEQIYELIHRLQDDYKITVILVSHDLSVVYRYATKVLCLNKRNLCFGVPQDVLTPEVLQKLYGAPFKYYHHLHNEQHA